MNIHRWRKIEATDPDKFDIIMKIQEIQKKIIEKTDELKKQENEIKQKEA